MELTKTYTELHKQLLRKQLNPFIELLFFAWSYVSFKRDFQLPEKLSIRTWINSFYTNKKAASNIENILQQIEKRIPELKSSLVNLFNAHISKFHEADMLIDWELYASVYSRFPFEESKQSDWDAILNLIIEDIVRKQKNLNADPLDISKLAANVFIGQITKSTSSKKGKKKIFIPSLSTGAIALEINQLTKTKYEYFGSENQMELYCIAVINFFINGIDTSGVALTKYDILENRFDYVISFLNSDDVENMNEFEKWFRVVAFNSDITIGITTQNFLFSKKFSMIRRYLLNDSDLVSIISLAPSIYSNTRVKHSMLVFNKLVKSDKILLVNGEIVEGNTKRQVKYTERDISELVNIVTNNEEKKGISKLFDVRELRSDDYSLLISKRLPDEKYQLNIKTIQKRTKINQQKLIEEEYTLQSHFNKLLSS